MSSKDGPLRALITACGSPGSAALIRALRGAAAVDIQLAGVDMNPYAIGAQIIDDFHLIPAASDANFIDRLTEIAREVSPDVLLPQSSAEIARIAAHADSIEAASGTKVLADTADVIRALEDKWDLANSLKNGGATFIAQTILCENADEVRAATHDLGFPARQVCVKPADAKGTRGFRKFCSDAERADAIMRGRPDDPRLTVDEYCRALDSIDEPVRVLVMEFIEGIERTVDVYCQDGRILVGFVKTREAMRNGLAMHFEIVESPALWAAAERIVEQYQCNFFLNIQFKGEKLLEVNPRVSTFVWDQHFNMPLLGLMHASGRLTASDLASVPRPRSGMIASRFYDQVHPQEDGTFFDLPAHLVR